MKLKASMPKLTDDLGNDLLADANISNLMQEVVGKIVKELQRKKESIIKERLKEIVGIEIDAEEEQKRRFKRFAIEYKGNEETIYFNDGSINGKRIVTFVKKDNLIDFDNDKFKLNTYYSYY